MMQKIRLILIFLFALVVFILNFSIIKCQEIKTFQGIVVDHQFESIPGAYIKNTNSNKISISKANGFFLIDYELNDSLIFLSLGYEVRIIPIRHIEGRIVKLKRLLHVLKQVEVYDFKGWEAFKREFVKLDVAENKVNIRGLPAGKLSRKPIALRSNEFSHKPSVGNYFLNPFSTLAYYLNEEEKQKRNLWLRMRLELAESAYWNVVNNDSIQHWIEVPDSLINDFIVFCNFNIVEKSVGEEYFYKSKIAELYPLFLEKSSMKK